MLSMLFEKNNAIKSLHEVWKKMICEIWEKWYNIVTWNLLK